MKKLFLLTAVCSFILAGCVDMAEQPGPIEGVWKMQHAKFSYPDTTVWWEADEMNMQTKVFTKGYMAFVSMYPAEDEDGAATVGGSGTYEVKGDTLIERLELMNNKSLVGNSFGYIIKVSGDTLIQEGPIKGMVPKEWENFHLKEVYLRVE